MVHMVQIEELVIGATIDLILSLFVKTSVSMHVLLMDRRRSW